MRKKATIPSNQLKKFCGNKNSSLWRWKPIEKVFMKLKTYFEMLKKFSCVSVAIQTSFAIGSCKTIMKYGWTITKVITPVDRLRRIKYSPFLLSFELELTYIGCLPLHWPLGLHARIDVPYFSSYPVLHLFLIKQ